MTEPGLFDEPTPPPLRKPAAGPVGRGPIKYTAYSAKQRHRCDDCVRVLYEASMNRIDAALPPRQARFTRKQGAVTLLLCAEHKNLRVRDEQEQAVLAELDEYR